MNLTEQDAALMRKMDAAFADAAERAGNQLACKAGCAQCCVGAFAIHALDGARLRRAMEELRVSNPEAARAVEERAGRWIEQWGGEFPGDIETGILGTSEEEEERFEEFADDAVCPALDPDTQKCAVYAGRPMTCRLFGPPVEVEGGYGCCELCFVGADEAEIARCAMQVPHEEEAGLVAQMADESQTVVACVLAGRGTRG